MKNLCSILLLFSASILASEPYDVLDSSYKGIEKNRLLRNEVIQRFNKLVAKRKKNFSKLISSQSIDQVNERNKLLIEKVKKELGVFPEKNNLKAKTIHRRNLPGGVILEKVVYESRENFHVTANLLLPSSASKNNKVPAVIIPCGHDFRCKGFSQYHIMGLSLARKGIAALVFDAIGQGERTQIFDPSVNLVQEHNLLGMSSSLVGDTFALNRTWDAIRSLDYLSEREEIDSTRLGASGNSGGGTVTSYVMAIDPRIAAAAPSCYITDFTSYMNARGTFPGDAEQHFPNQMSLGLDQADFVTLRAPKPTLILAAKEDFFPIEGTRNSDKDARAIFDIFPHKTKNNVKGNYALFEDEGPHSYSKKQRERALEFFGKHFGLAKLDEKGNVIDENFLNEGNLSLTPNLVITKNNSGVIRDFKSSSLMELNLKRSQTFLTAREKMWAEPKIGLAKVLELMKLDQYPTKLSFIKKGEFTVSDLWNGVVEKFLIEKENNIPIPVLIYRPNNQNAKKPLVVFHHEGKEIHQKSYFIDQLQKGQLIISIDLPGFGELFDNTWSYDSPGRLFLANDQIAAAFQMSGPALLSERVNSIELSFKFLKEIFDNNQMFNIYASEGTWIPLVHSLIKVENISKVTSPNALQSWEDAVIDPLKHSFHISNVLNDALKFYDLSNLIDFSKGNNISFDFSPKSIPAISGNLSKDINYKLYNLEEGWRRLPDFSKMNTSRIGVVKKIDLREFPLQRTNFGIVFNFNIFIENEGLYEFILNSDDGSKLHIGGELIINNDGGHPDTTKREIIKLTRGWYPLKLEYFQGTGGKTLGLRLKNEENKITSF